MKDTLTPVQVTQSTSRHVRFREPLVSPVRRPPLSDTTNQPAAAVSSHLAAPTSNNSAKPQSAKMASSELRSRKNASKKQAQAVTTDTTLAEVPATNGSSSHPTAHHAVPVSRSYMAMIGLHSDPLLLAAVLAFITFAVYLSTAYPTVSGGDAGELAVVSCNLAVAHPPGYPTYTMLAYMWNTVLGVVPISRQWSPALRMVTGNIVYGSVTSAVLFLTTYLLVQPQKRVDSNSSLLSALCSYALATASAFSFSFSPTVWLYTIQTEVFALNNMLCSMLLLGVVIYFRAETEVIIRAAAVDADNTTTATAPANADKLLLHTAYAGALVCGLAMTNQHTTVFFTVPIAAVLTLNLLIQHTRLLTIVPCAMLLLSMTVGLLPYVYLPLASMRHPYDTWGMQHTLEGFITHFFRQEYGTFQLAASGIGSDTSMLARLYVYAQVTASEMLYAPLLLAAVGALALPVISRSHRFTGVTFLACYLTYQITFHYLANLDLRPLYLGVQARFWQQPNLIVSVWGAVGLNAVAAAVDSLLHRRSNDSTHQQQSHTVVRSGLLLACLLYSTLQLSLRYQQLDHSKTDIFQQYGQKQLSIFPPHSLVLLNGDLNNNLLKYFHQCEGQRSTDVQLLGLQQMSWPWFVPMERERYAQHNVTFPGDRYHPYEPTGFSLRQFLKANAKSYGKQTYVCGPFKDGDHSLIKQQHPTVQTYYEELPFGLCRKLYPAKRGLPKGRRLASEIRQGLRALSVESLQPYDQSKHTPDTWESSVYHDQWNRLIHIASFTAFHANQPPSDPSAKSDETGPSGQRALLKLAAELYDRILNHETLLMERGILNAAEYRSCGVVFGMYAKSLADISESDELVQRANDKMLRCWQTFAEQTPTDKEISNIVKQRVNPYSGKAV